MKLKRLFGLLFVTLMTFVLVACGNKVNLLEIVDEAIDGIEYQDDDKKTSVTLDVFLPETSKISKDAKIVWTSENEDIISSEGIVTRPEDKNTSVKLTVTVTLNGSKEEGSTRLTVKKADESNNGGNNGGGNVDISDGKIGSVEEFMAITDFSKNYELENDIDFKGAEIKPLGKIGSMTWQGVVDAKGVFSGTFDGKGFALKNFKLTGSAHPEAFRELNGDGVSSYMYVSLFPSLKGTVKNLALVNANIVGDGFTGGIAGLIDLGGKLSNVFFSGSVTAAKSWGSTENWAVPAGAVAGLIGGDATVENVLVIPALIQGGNLVTGFNYSKKTSGIYVVDTNVLDVTEYATPEKGDETGLLQTVGATKGDKAGIPGTFSSFAKYYNN